MKSTFRQHVPTWNGYVPDTSAVSIGVYVTIRRLETDIAWSEHENWQRLGDVVSAIVKKLGEPDS